MFTRFTALKLLTELELHLELQQMRAKGLTEEDLAGYLLFYRDSYITTLGQQTQYIAKGIN